MDGPPKKLPTGSSVRPFYDVATARVKWPDRKRENVSVPADERGELRFLVRFEAGGRDGLGARWHVRAELAGRND